MDPEKRCRSAESSSRRSAEPRSPLHLSRRAFLAGALATAIAVPSGLGSSLRVAAAQVADDQEEVSVVESPGSVVGQSGPGFYTFSLAAGSGGPLGEGVTNNKYKHEIGYARYEGDSFVLGLHPGDKELARQEWISRRIGKFSFRDGAVMVEARGELSPTGCFAIEMRHQAYKDRRYIRSNWLCLDPHDGHIHIQTDGFWNEMQIVADHQHDGYTPVRPPGEWNTFLFVASGDYLEGWVNGEKAIAGIDGRWGTGNISLVAMRIDRMPFRARFRNLRVWDRHPPDPATVW
jgi:hypothetical protein